jgi:isoleucyl-tRNA synthetase
LTKEHSDNDILISDESIAHLSDLFARHGSDCWYALDISELLPPSRKRESDQWYTGMDTMDVWMDSGFSWKAALSSLVSHYRSASKSTTSAASTFAAGSPIVADVYLEGSDQHRGWFQSSLLTSIALQDQPPFLSLVSHGFVMDENKRKMSKSLGNVIEPSQLIDENPQSPDARTSTESQKKKKQPKPSNQGKLSSGLGADTLRLWAASVDYSSDMSIGPVSLSKISEFHSKLRVTFKFLIGNLMDFSSADVVPYKQLHSVDRYMLTNISSFAHQVHQAYSTFTFHRVYSLLTNFISTECSAFYFDINKDRLYCDGPGSLSRRSVQTTFVLLLETLLKSVAPILPFLAHEMYSLIDPALYPLLKYNPHGILSANEGSISPDDINRENEGGPFMLGWISLLSPTHAYGAEPTSDRSSLVSLYECANCLRKIVNIGLSQAKSERVLSTQADILANVPMTLSQLRKIGNTNEAQIDLFVPKSSTLEVTVRHLQNELELLWIVSKVNVHSVNESYLDSKASLSFFHNFIYTSQATSVSNTLDDAKVADKFQPYKGNLYLLTTIRDVSGTETKCCIVIRLADDCKCPRCWRYNVPSKLRELEPSLDHDHHLCARCYDAMYAYCVK